MKVETLKELEALIKVCRKHGVHSITVDGISMLINEPPEQHSETASNKDVHTPVYTDEDILTWSSAPTYAGDS
jgi:hypothetical protein